MSTEISKGLGSGYEGNAPEIEMSFAVKCVEFSNAHWKLCESVKPSTLRLTKHDADMLASVKEDFPQLFQGDRLSKLDEIRDLKSPEAKEQWRKWIAKWQDKIDEYNFGTLLRLKASSDYSEENSMFVTRIQFFAIEVARNHAGANDWIFENKDVKKKGKAT